MDRNTGLAPVDPEGRNAVITADLLDTRVSDTVSVTSQPISLLSHSAYSRSNNNKRPAPSLQSRRSSGASEVSCSTKRTRRDSSGDHRDPEQQDLEDDTDRDYTDKATYGPEVSSVIACAQKVYWQKSPNPDVAAQLLERSKVPANCSYMTTKVFNTSVFSKTSGDIRTREHEMQKLDKLHASSTTANVKALHQFFRVKQQLTLLQEQHPDIALPNIEDQINLLKDGLKLAGMTPSGVIPPITASWAERTNGGAC